MGNAILVKEKDNVVTCVSDLKKGEEATYRVGSKTKQVIVNEDVPFGHKIAITKIAKEGDIIKYGEVIGRAKTDIEVGKWVHTHNTEETYVPTR
jgi:altronate dehydratase